MGRVPMVYSCTGVLRRFQARGKSGVARSRMVQVSISAFRWLVLFRRIDL